MKNTSECKYDKEAESFRDYFKDYKEKRIVIYGIGRRTLTLLPRIAEFNVVGLLDRDPTNIGVELNGVPVLSMEKAKKYADLIIINSDPSNYKTIYKRICDCGIDVFYSNGEKADKRDIETENVDTKKLWSISLDEIKKRISENDVISFDVFDTLLERNVIDPADIFDLLDDEYKGVFLEKSFRIIRQEAVGRCKKDNPTLEEIYKTICDDYDIAYEDVGQKMMEKEILLEEKYISPREELISLLEYAFSLHKQVIIVSDMYLKKEIIHRLLSKYMADVEIESIFVSCDYRKSKLSGDLWKVIKDKFEGLRILHIGDELVGDYNIPTRLGIKCVKVSKKNELLEAYGFSELLSVVTTSEDRLVVGLIKNRLLENHYSVNCRDKKVSINAKQLGYCVFGPIIFYYLSRLIDDIRGFSEAKIIFLARDGYLLYEDYEILREKLEKYFEVRLSDSCYLPISRRMVLVATYSEKEAWEELLKIPFNGTYQEFLLKRFNVQVNDRTMSLNDKRWENSTIEEMEQRITPYIKEIQMELETEKESYRRYLEEHGFFNNADEFLMDLGCQGTNQYFLQKITEKKYHGRYFYANLCEENHYLNECEIQAYFQKEDDGLGEKSTIRKRSAFLESFFTAPYGMLRYILPSGECVLEENKKNQDEFEIKEIMNHAALEFIEDYILLSNKSNRIISLELVDSIYKLFFSEENNLDEEVKNSFFFDNDMIGSAEQKLIGD